MAHTTLELARPLLGKRVSLVIDRPMGSRHPEHPDLIFTVNYGYVPHILAADGEGLDAYVLGVDTPLSEFEGTCIAIIHRRDDDDDKLIVVPDTALALTDTQILEQIHFAERYFDSIVLRQ